VIHDHCGEGAFALGQGDDGGHLTAVVLNGDGDGGVGVGLHGIGRLQLGVVHQDGGQLGADGGAVGVQQVAGLAADDAGAHSHTHAVLGPLGHVSHVGVGAEVAGGGDHVIERSVPGEDGGDLGAGDVAVAGVGAGAVAGGQPHVLRPGGGVGVPLAGHVGEAGGLRHGGLAGHVVERLVHSGPGHGAVGGEDLHTGIGGAHDAVFDDVVHRGGVPGALIHIRPVGGSLGLLSRGAHHRDAALALGVGVVGAHHAAQLVHNVVDQHLVVDHHAVLQQGVVLEHDEAVAAGLQHIVVGGQRVGLGGVNGLAVHLHVLYPALAVHLHELLLVVEHHRGGNRGVDGIGQAGDLQEPAVLLRRHTRAHLQRVQNVLARGLHHAGLVAEGMHVDDLLIGDLPRGDVGPHAPAVDKGHVGVQHHPVGVRAQVAQIGLGAAYRALPGGRVLGGQVHVGLGHDLLQHPGKLVVDALHKGRSGLVLSGAVLGRHQLAGDLARLGVDDHLAQVGQLGARLGHQHVLPGLVLLGLGKGAVGVPVDQHVDAGGVGNHLGGGPGGALLVHAQVPQRHHVVGALRLGRVYRLLHHVIQVLALVALAEAVDVVPRGVLEIGRGGLGEGLRRVDAHVADLHVAVGQHLIAVQHRLPLQVGEVGAQIGILRLLLCQGQEVVHAVVKLVVARNGQIVAHLVHDLHDVRAPMGPPWMASPASTSVTFSAP